MATVLTSKIPCKVGTLSVVPAIVWFIWRGGTARAAILLRPLSSNATACVWLFAVSSLEHQTCFECEMRTTSVAKQQSPGVGTLKVHC